MSQESNGVQEVREVRNEVKEKKPFKLYSVQELFELPEPEWLIEKVIETKTLGVLFGASGSGKSFAALDWALSVATGSEWQGLKVKKGRVVYVVGEGTSGVVKRVKAWMKHNSVESVDNAFFLLQAPQLMEAGDVERLTATLHGKGEKPILIVLDTLARCFVGGEENSAKDVGKFIEGCRDLQAKTDAVVFIVHHTGKAKDGTTALQERGSSALRAAADVMISLKNGKNGIVISNEKQKDDKEFPSVPLRLKQICLGKDPKTGEVLTSCVLVLNEGGSSETGSTESSISHSEKVALEALAPLEVAKSGDWRRAICATRNRDISPKTFDNWRKTLLGKGLVKASEDNHAYYLTEEGKAILNKREEKEENAIFHGTPSAFE